MKREFTAVYQRRGKWYVAWVEEVPGVNTQGRTKQEAKENLGEAIKLVLSANKKLLSRELGRTKLQRESLEVALPA